MNSILTILYPNICLLCKIRHVEPKQHLCNTCLDRLHPIGSPICGKCGGENNGILEICSACLDLKATWDRGFSLWKFSDSAKELIHEFKYHNRTELTRYIALTMSERLAVLGYSTFDLITFVPMHWLKKILRGYNQSELLANELAQMLKIPCKKSVARVKFARQQALLNRQARLKNIKNVFKLKSKTFSFVENKHILVVDDVFTTGATFKEMTRQLHCGGVASITIISIARG